MFDDLEKTIKEYSVLKKEFQDKLTEGFLNVMRSYFDKDPECTKIVWTQYTPYFNDGDPCEFSVNDPEFFSSTIQERTEDEDEDEDEEDYGNGGNLEIAWPNGTTVNYVDLPNGRWERQEREATEAEKVRRQVTNFIMSTEMEDVLLAAFGDHVKVIVTRKGIDVKEYDHD